MEDTPAIEDPPPPPPFPPLKGREIDPAILSGLQEGIPQDFQRIIVHGKQKSPERRRRAAFKPSDQHLITARLKLFCYDKTTGKPIPNVQVQLKALPGNDPDKVVAKTVSNAFGNRAVSKKDGFVMCKVLAGYPYRVSATANGYHDFGHMGETLTLTPQETEVVQGEVGLVPVRISVVVTLRELRPIHLAADSLQGDTTGQVNPLTSIPRVDPRSGVPPQKVSFYSNEGIKMDFVATTVESEDILVGWPSVLGGTAESASCTLGVYSTDGNGHCFFYGPKILGRRGNTRKPKDWATIDVGRWEYARKFHLRINQESPVAMLFDETYTKPVGYPAHIARYPPRALRSPSPTRGIAGPGRSREQILSSFLESAAEVAAVASTGGSVADPNEPEAPAAKPPAAEGEASAAAVSVAAGEGAAATASVKGSDRTGSPSQRPGSPVRTAPSRAGGDAPAAGSAGAAGSRPISALSRSRSAPRNSRSSPAVPEDVAAGEGDALAHEDLEQELRAYPDNNIHNYVDPGQYRLQMKDPSKLLIFYTYSGDGEAAEINRAQNAVVPFTMHSADESFIHPRDGSVLRPTKFPVQLYCRARPYFQIAVYDLATLEEIGASYSLQFSIDRVITSGGSSARHVPAIKDDPSRTVPVSRRRRNGGEDDQDLSALDLDQANDNDDSKIYPYKLINLEETIEPMYSGLLGEIKDKMWMTPGEKYRVTVHLRSPFMEYNAVQVRTANWELEPFVFYAVKKVALLIEVRERYNQLPIPNTEVVIEVKEPPQAPRPPVVKPEWCEDARTYALRIIDQLVDYVVQNNRERVAAEKGPLTEYRGFTDGEGLLSFELPPEAKVYVRAINSVDFEETEASREVQLTTNKEQFVGFQLERITRTAAVVLDSETNEGVAGFELRAYDVTEYSDMPLDGTRKIRHLLDTDMLDRIDTSRMEPFAVEMTGPDGAINAPFCRRAGRVIKVEVSRTPRTHHMPALVMARGKNSTYVVTYDRQSVVFKAPPRPRVKVSCHDTCTFEEVFGVRFRVMVRPFGPSPFEPPPPSRHTSRSASQAGRAASIAGSHRSGNSSSLPPIAGATAHPYAFLEGEEGTLLDIPEVGDDEGVLDDEPLEPYGHQTHHSSHHEDDHHSADVAVGGSAPASRTSSRVASRNPSIAGSQRSQVSAAGAAAGAEGVTAVTDGNGVVDVSGGAPSLDGSSATPAGGSRAGSRASHHSRSSAGAEGVVEGGSGSQAGSRTGSRPASLGGSKPPSVAGSRGGSRVLSPSGSQRDHGGSVVETIPEEQEGDAPAEGAPAGEGQEGVKAAPGSKPGSRAPSQAGSRALSQAGSRGVGGGSQRSRGSAAEGPSREASSINVLREQHKETLAEIDKLEAGWNVLQQQYEADQDEALAMQKKALEMLLAQLKVMVTHQEERLEALIQAEEAAAAATAAAEAQAAAVAEAQAAAEAAAAAAAAAPASEQDDEQDDEAQTREAVPGRTGKHQVEFALDANGEVQATSSEGQVPSRPAGLNRLSMVVVLPGENQEDDLLAASREGGITPAPAFGPSKTLRNRLKDPLTGAGFGGGFSSVLGVFGSGLSRMLGHGKGDGEEEDDEEEAMRKLRAAEEEMMAVFNPAPEEQEPWGRIVWDNITGNEENDDLILDADCEVAVQIFPAWPYDARSQILKGRCVGHVGPPEFRFYLPRDGNAFRFWLDRDNALPGFWDEESTPLLPYHSLARLQPMAPAQNLLSRPNADMKLLRPPAYDPNTNADDPDQPQAWQPRLQLFHYGNSPGQGPNRRLVVSHGCVGGPGFIGGAPGVVMAQEGESFFGGAAAGVDTWNYEVQTIRPDGTRVLHRVPSAMQFDPNNNSEDINELAWQQLRLSDASYLPLERTRLLQFLTRWGSFPHIAGGHCKACGGMDRPPDTNPLLLAESPPTPRHMSEVPQVGFGVGFSAASGWSRSGAPTGTGGDDMTNRINGGNSTDMVPGFGVKGVGNLVFKSRLLPRHELSAGWVFESRPPPRPEGPAIRRSVPDRFARTHTIMHNSEAVYCRSPFFTWWLPNNGGVHVTMCDGLYRELIPLVDSVALSLEYMDQHLDKVRQLNEGRCQEGRFLLGHQVVDSFSGGVFIVDVSTAQPFSGVSFILEQLCKMFDFWATETPMGCARPRFNILLCSREVIECWRSSLGTVTTNMAKRLLPWYQDIKYKMPTSAGFNMVKALRTAGTMAKSEVPIFLLCGGLVDATINTPADMSKVLYEMQLACLNSKAPMQPVVAVELFPMPQARLAGPPRVKTTATGTGDEEDDMDRPIVPLRVGDDVSTEVSVEEAAALGFNIFALLQESLTASRIRLLEVFREVDKDADGALDWQQLYRLVLRLVADATPAHVRYVQLLLDCTGDNMVRYKDLACAVRAAGRGGISVALRDKLEVQLVLHKMAILMLLGKITPEMMFNKYDNDHDGFWSEKELSNMLKDLFPGLRPAEHQLLFDAWKGVDKNQDGRISLDEFHRAFNCGGVPGLPGTSILAHPDQVQRMKDAGELDDFMIMAMKASEENRRLDRVRSAGFPLSEMLVRVAGATRGVHRRLDLGRARAFADRIDLKPLEAVREAIYNNLQQLLEFERAYGKQLTYEQYHGRVMRNARTVGSLTADPPSPVGGASRLTRPQSARARPAGTTGGSPFAATSGGLAAAAAAAGGSPPGDSWAIPVAASRPRSAARSRASSRPRSAVPAASASASAAGGASRPASRPASAMAASVGGGSGGAGSVAGSAKAGSARSGSRSASASRQRSGSVASWVASANASDDPHLRKLAARESVDHKSAAGDKAASTPHLGRENSATGSQPWHTSHHGSVAGSVAGVSRELSQRSSLLAALVGPTGEGGEGDPRLAGRLEYRPPSERSLQRPRASYGSRTPSAGPSAEPSNASIGGGGGGGGGSAAGDGGGSAAGGDSEGFGPAATETGGSRPSSVQSRRRASHIGSVSESVAASVTMPPLAYGRLPSATGARKSLPLKTAMLGFDDDYDATSTSGLPFILPDPNAGPLSGRPMSASRRSVNNAGGSTLQSQSSRGSGWA